MGCVHGKCCSQPAASSSPDSTNHKENRSFQKKHGECGETRNILLTKGSVEVVQVPAYGYELKYSYLSQRGYYPDAPDKANQDSFCIHKQFNGDPNDHFFGVFDGHGQYGTQCSEFVKIALCQNLAKDPLLYTDVVQAYHSAFAITNWELHTNNGIDDSMSGTTAITVLVRGKTLYVANVGDSRAVIAEKRGDRVVAVDLSSDQTPFRADECERVKKCGARVLSLDQIDGLKDPTVQCWGSEEKDDGGDPPRLWVPNENYPGTAFTRSVGDYTAESIGVTAVPEVTVMELTADHPFFVIASDGVFEFLPSQAVVDMVAKFKDPCDACAAIVAESHRLWLQNETRTDDITIIIVQINGLQDSGTAQRVMDVNIKPVQQVVATAQGDESTFAGQNLRNPHSAQHEILQEHLGKIEVSSEQSPIWIPPSPICQNYFKELVNDLSLFFLLSIDIFLRAQTVTARKFVIPPINRSRTSHTVQMHDKGERRQRFLQLQNKCLKSWFTRL